MYNLVLKRIYQIFGCSFVDVSVQIYFGARLMVKVHDKAQDDGAALKESLEKALEEAMSAALMELLEEAMDVALKEALNQQMQT